MVYLYGSLENQIFSRWRTYLNLMNHEQSLQVKIQFRINLRSYLQR